MSQALKQLKKNDFLAAMTVEPMTRGQIVDALSEFEFLSSWLDYLTEHFTNSGKVVVGTDESGEETYSRKAGKGGNSGPQVVYLVEFDEDAGFIVTSRTLEKGETMNKEIGEANTPAAAVKRATQRSFATYKEETAQLRKLLEA